MPEHSIAFIGGGHMASALIGGLVRAGRPASDISVVEPDEAQRARLARDFGVTAQSGADKRLATASTVVWAVKPQHFRAAAAPCMAHVGKALQLSVMAGVHSESLVAASGSARVVRAMPNTPALIGRGIAGLFAREAVTAAERERVEQLLAPTGSWLWLSQEGDLDAVTALSGSGPAYVFFVMEAMIRAGVEMGLPEAQSRTLVLATFDGATALAAGSALTPAALRAQVTSRGGTTQAAIESLQADGVDAAFYRALAAARARARELSGASG
jgi:pyrroline-5-carboxylate reductase